ncbi:unnamed protein product [Haemonchus placei]|uniref:Transmembrane protein n=1 Tax=Haemonchus placei TaxID=6290 RepID=A0A0N4X0N0_HAEPC|nr:unnamed protein product [Haemonchus placei]
MLEELQVVPIVINLIPRIGSLVLAIFFRQKVSKEKRSSEESHPKSLDGSARDNQNVVQPSEKTSSISPSPAPSIAPDPDSPTPSTPGSDPQTSSTTTAKPKKSLSGASFFIGFAVGIMVIGMIVAAVRFWMHRRAERRIPYTIY